MFKNVASQKAVYFAFDATTNVPKTGDAANITGYVSKDWGAVTVLGDTSATEMDATNAPGLYLFDLTQAETNADTLVFSAKSATANIKVIGAPVTVATFPTTGILAPTTSGRTLDVTATGGAGIDWANVENPTTSLALTGTTIASTQKVDIDTIKTNPVVNAGTVTFPTNATLASTANITAGTITTVTNLTNAPTSGDFTAVMKTSLNAATPSVTVSDKTGFSLTSAYDPAKTASQAGDAMTLTSAYDFAKGTVAMAESYAADGATMTPAQAFYLTTQILGESSISGTIRTVKKLDGSTTAATYTLDSGTAPTSITRAT